MPISSPSSPSLMPPNQSSGGPNLKLLANLFRHNTGADQTYWSAMAEAMTAMQRQLDSLQQILQSPVPQPQPLQVTDGAGNLVAVVGDIVDPSTNKSFSGVWLDQAWIAGTGPGNAEVTIDTSGNVVVGGNLTVSGTISPSSGFTAQATANPWFGTPTGTRAIGATYQNLTGKVLLVTITLQANTSSTIQAKCDSGSSPSTVVGEWLATTATVGAPGSFIVLPNYYYTLATVVGSASLGPWVEYN